MREVDFAKQKTVGENYAKHYSSTILRKINLSFSRYATASSSEEA